MEFLWLGLQLQCVKTKLNISCFVLKKFWQKVSRVIFLNFEFSIILASIKALQNMQNKLKGIWSVFEKVILSDEKHAKK